MVELSQRNPWLVLVLEYSSEPTHLCTFGITVDGFAELLKKLGFHQGYVIDQNMKPFSLAHNFRDVSAPAKANLLLKKA